MRRIVLTLCLALLTTPAWAADWDDAFPAAAVKSYVTGSGIKVMVAGAGGDTADRDAAATAVMDALRANSSVKLVMSSDSLGDVSGLDDAALVAKAKSMPVDRVFVVRVFPASAGQYSAVVTMYKLDGSVAGAFTAGSDEPLVASAGGASTSSPSGGLSGQAVAAVTAATGSAKGDMEARIKEYEDRRIWLQGWAAIDGNSGQVVSTWSVPQLGRYGEPLTPKEFLGVVGRDDLVAEYKKRNGVRGGIAAGGAVLMLGGLAYPTLLTEKPKGGRSVWECETSFSTYSTSSTTTSSSTTSSKAAVKGTVEEDCAYNEANNIYDKQKNAWIVGGTLAGLGYVGVMVPLFINPNPTTANERLKMVDDYNANLRKELGLPESMGVGPYPEPKPTPTASLFISPTQATLTVEF